MVLLCGNCGVTIELDIGGPQNEFLSSLLTVRLLFLFLLYASGQLTCYIGCKGLNYNKHGMTVTAPLNDMENINLPSDAHANRRLDCEKGLLGWVSQQGGICGLWIIRLILWIQLLCIMSNLEPGQ